ncbi:hypoxia induced protein conserved region-domain-containing protein [Ochromonadaceae sp. CCMP2298]|nr:hypoxia induced protein conserved region-domain-containing protein [Ochromonadaceae sp. CCMP2298]|mmetsp:Transcript_20600/g.45841  ORF Transcript_20600/g.45841 Transcript_20600/m.45841 type:complete len:92 (-) Transcript_20600:524-799(-)|eukprot:CAMPEP_0173178940 /NCGR_PEP_ID=MMETSP1141-20130122/5828_1 /TAXON_ID=483371 /ORGANISM="non described non described, Strain CCMP2298" /LENGTH=91 /DNA_ID=CAMNT_0014101513 /DNA_START=332 /DNA_END=607 /DNA_ORIENTATION=-
MEEESFVGKLIRKCSAEPLVPIGSVATLIFLGTGFNAFINGNKIKSQSLMRGRVLAQGFTIAAICMGAFFGMKPHDRPKNVEEILTGVKTK